MASRGKGRRGGGRSNNQPPQAFDQRAFMEVIGAATATIAQTSVMTTTIAQANATLDQGGPSNLQRFKASSSNLQGRRGTNGSRSLVPASW